MQAVRSSAIAIAVFISIAMIMNIATALRPGKTVPSAPLKLSSQSYDWQYFKEWNAFAIEKTTITLSVLPWQLKGIFYGKRPDVSQVILSINGQEDTIYHVGERIVGDVRVHQILENAVVISRQGRLERLSLINSPSVA
jgi:type II secretory pathway component PulC